MAELVPPTILGTIEFFEQRIADWTSDPDAIGLSAQQVNDLAGRLVLARNAYNAAQQLRQASKNATATQKSAVGDLARYGADLIAVIRAFADVQPDPDAVFDTAELDKPASRGAPLPPPVPATNVRLQLANTGELTARWTGTVANGTVYAVYRRFAQNTPYTQVGVSTTKSFVDRAVPVGTAEVSYYLVTLRDGQESAASDVVSFRFGAMAPGIGTNQLSGDGPLGLAA